jgi:hypothetical protein
VYPDWLLIAIPWVNEFVDVPFLAIKLAAFKVILIVRVRFPTWEGRIITQGDTMSRWRRFRWDPPYCVRMLY